MANTGKTINENEQALADIGADALMLVAGVYKCIYTGCTCPAGRHAKQVAHDALNGVVTDTATALAYAEGIILATYYLSGVIERAPVEPEAMLSINFVLCEALRIGGVISESDIKAAIFKSKQKAFSERGH